MAKHWIIIALILIISVLGAYFVMTSNYPIVFVDSSAIIAKNFNEDYAGAINYYKNISDVYGKEDKAILDFKEVKLEIQRAVLDNLIENSIIEKELKNRLKPVDLKRLIEQKISEALKNEDISRAAEKIYGLSFDKFKERVLVPQAKLEILQGQFYLENKNYDQWLQGEKSKKKIIILIPGFSWDGGHVILKK